VDWLKEFKWVEVVEEFYLNLLNFFNPFNLLNFSQPPSTLKFHTKNLILN